MGDEEVQEIVSRVVKGSRERTGELVAFSRDAPAVHDDNEKHVRRPDPVTGEPAILIPDPDEMLRVRCANCEQDFERTRRVIERDNRRWSFWTCSKRCRKAQLAKNEPTLRIP